MEAASEASPSTSQWVPFSERNAALPPALDAATEPTAVAAASSGSGGRVARPARRRTRTSRKAPVTLLNTDTANFRAMVQQFTGFPSGPQYRPGFHDAAPASLMTPPTLHFPRPFLEQPQLQFLPPHQHQHHHQQQQQQQPPFPKANQVFLQTNNSDPTSSEMGDVFLFGPGPAQPNIDTGNFRWR